VVTPVYNGEAHLRECIESVLRQTYSNWEYTIVNNCSTDRTLEIATEYAQREPRIRLQNNQTFVRVIENHNIAFRQISPLSKYCKVVAADDWIFPECLEKMVDIAERHPSVAMVGAYQLCGRGVAWDGVPYPSQVVAGRELCREKLLGGPYVFGTATTLMYRADIVRSRHAFFPESNLHGDSEVCYEFLENQDFGFVHQILTFCRVDEGSLTSFSERFNTYLPATLNELLRYGPRYLTSKEMERRLQEQRSEYRKYLGRQVFKRRDPTFWKYHRTKLTELGSPLRFWQLAIATLQVAAEAALNPKATAEHHLLRKKSVAAGSS